MKKLLALLVILLCCAQVQAQNVEGQIIASQYGEFRVPGQTSGGTFTFPSDVCQVSGGNKNFSAFAAGRAIKIVDASPSLTEIATPSSVYIDLCAVNMATTYTHVPPYYLTSGTGGLQEAITANQQGIAGPNSIILNAEWYSLITPRSAAAVIASIQGNSQLALVDVTTGPYTWYLWSGSSYVAFSQSTPSLASPGPIGSTSPSTGSFTGLTSSGTDTSAAASFSGVATFNGSTIFNQPLQISYSSTYACLVCFNSSSSPSVYNTGLFTVGGGGSDLRVIAGGGFTFDIQSNNIQIEPSVPLEFNNTSYAPDLSLSRDTAIAPTLDIGSSGANASGYIKAASYEAGLLYSAAGTPLPSCATGNTGQEAVVVDATSPAFLGTYTSGGAIKSPVMCNGSNWVTY